MDERELTRLQERTGRVVGNNIRRYAKLLGASQRRLREFTGVPPGTMNDLMNGRLGAKVAVMTLVRVADALGIEPMWLFSEGDMVRNIDDRHRRRVRRRLGLGD